MWCYDSWIYRIPSEILAEALELSEQDKFETWSDYKVPAVMMDYQER